MGRFAQRWNYSTTNLDRHSERLNHTFHLMVHRSHSPRLLLEIPDVYVVPTAGGDPKRLTYHPAKIGSRLGADGKSVVFASDQ